MIRRVAPQLAGCNAAKTLVTSRVKRGTQMEYLSEYDQQRLLHLLKDIKWGLSTGYIANHAERADNYRDCVEPRVDVFIEAMEPKPEPSTSEAK